MSKDNGGPAFPLLADVRPSIDREWCGMTLRDYFAAKAFQGAMASAEGLGSMSNEKLTAMFRDVGRLCYLAADAMLEERKQ